MAGRYGHVASYKIVKIDCNIIYCDNVQENKLQQSFQVKITIICGLLNWMKTTK